MVRSRKIVDTVLEEGAQDLPKASDGTVGIEPITPEVMDDMPVIIEPKTLTLEQNFAWNFEEMKINLQTHIERYTGLVVTDENLKSMEKTQKEIASLRTKINKFRLAVKNEMEKPYKVFEQQVGELLDMVFSVEKPLKDQLEIYENKRREAKTQAIWGIIHQTASNLGLEEQYLSQMAIDEKWLNRTATLKEITESIQERVCWLLDVQAKDRQAASFARQKAKMSKLLCQSISAEAGLVTPLTYEEIEMRIATMPDIDAVEEYIKQEVSERKEREERAAMVAVEQVVPASPPVAPVPPSPPQASEITWDVVLRLPGINVQQSLGFQKYLAGNDVKYEVVSQSLSRPGEPL